MLTECGYLRSFYNSLNCVAGMAAMSWWKRWKRNPYKVSQTLSPSSHVKEFLFQTLKARIVVSFFHP